MPQINHIKHAFLAAVFALTIFTGNFCTPVFSNEPLKTPENTEYQSETKYPDYSDMYIGKDKFENFNRKMFNFNTKLNKYALRPAHVVWASIMPKFGMERIQNAYKNIEYPKRLVSTLLQRDFKAAKTETMRFLANSTIGLGGMFDPAKSLLKIEPREEDIEQGLAKCKIKRGPYLVLPVISGTTPRAIAGRIIETGLDPTTYVASPAAVLAKMGLFINRTSFMQPLMVMLERTYADPYDIVKKLYGIENYIRFSNLDRRETLEAEGKILNSIEDELVIEESTPLLASKDTGISLSGENFDETKESSEEKPLKITEENEILNVNEEAQNSDEKDDLDAKIASNEVLKGKASTENTLHEAIQSTPDLDVDIFLKDFFPQGPVIDSMRTALFDLPGIDESMWSELSIWNRSFQKRIKMSSIELTEGREKYKYRYILQRDKNAPVAILYPSIGEGVMAHHSTVLAKMFYDAGYSVIIQGSHFHFDFVKSMPEGYRPGIPKEDAKHLKVATGKILDTLKERYERTFPEKILLGTSFGAMTTLFIAEDEAKNPKLNINKYISINPPIELIFALKELDKNNDEWNKNPSNIKHKTAVTAAKILDLFNQKDENKDFEIKTLPFSDYEAKIITGFILRQKLSDLIFTIENTKKADKTALYRQINNMSFRDYANRYLLKNNEKNIEELSYEASLHSISEFLRTNKNYKIYHAIDDYLVNKNQLQKLREYTGKKTVLVSHGGHLGFLYRDEFISDLKSEISPKTAKNEDNPEAEPLKKASVK